jgi:hypothetical protein
MEGTCVVTVIATREVAVRSARKVVVVATRLATTNTVTRVQESLAIANSPIMELYPGAVPIEVPAAVIVTAVTVIILVITVSVPTATGVVLATALASVGSPRLHTRERSCELRWFVHGGELE